jgi:hypothetical protein
MIKCHMSLLDFPNIEKLSLRLLDVSNVPTDYLSFANEQLGICWYHKVSALEINYLFVYYSNFILLKTSNGIDKILSERLSRSVKIF